MIKSPTIGEVRQGWEIGYKSDVKHIWQACEKCGKERWVKLTHNNARCLSCSNKGKSRHRDKSHLWKGGRIHTGGYITLKLEASDFFYSMCDNRGYVKEHRLVMAKSLGRCLHLWEIVHHKHTRYPAGSKEDKEDNRIENLQLVSDDRHKQISILERRIKRLETEVEEQGKFIRLLQWQIREKVKDEFERDI